MKSIEGLIDRNWVNSFCIHVEMCTKWMRLFGNVTHTPRWAHTSQIVRIRFVQVWIDLQAEREGSKKRKRERERYRVVCVLFWAACELRIEQRSDWKFYKWQTLNNSKFKQTQSWSSLNCSTGITFDYVILNLIQLINIRKHVFKHSRK